MLRVLEETMNTTQHPKSHLFFEGRKEGKGGTLKDQGKFNIPSIS